MLTRPRFIFSQGYTAQNLSDKGVHEVSARRFCLVAADHPLVSAISENAEKLQMGEISMMPASQRPPSRTAAPQVHPTDTRACLRRRAS